MKNNQLMIYGAYGYAGELMVREAVAQRLRPIIAGRDAEKLKPIATELSLECRAFGVRNTGSNLQDISVLLLGRAAGRRRSGPAPGPPPRRSRWREHVLRNRSTTSTLRARSTSSGNAMRWMKRRGSKTSSFCQVPEPTSCQPTVWRRCLRRNCPSPRASIWLSRSAPIQVSARSTP